MPKNKTGRHLQFYMDCMKHLKMPLAGLCTCSWNGYIDGSLLRLFKPENASLLDY